MDLYFTFDCTNEKPRSTKKVAVARSMHLTINKLDKTMAAKWSFCSALGQMANVSLSFYVSKEVIFHCFYGHWGNLWSDIYIAFLHHMNINVICK